MAMRRSGVTLLLRSARVCAESSGGQPGSASILTQLHLRNAQQPALQSFSGLKNGCMPVSYRGFRTGCIAQKSIQAVVPSMGDSITEGTIAGISKAVGDTVEEDETIAQIETDKVTIDVRAPQAGVITTILVSDEENVTVGQIIANIETDIAAALAKKAPAAAKAAPQSEAAAAPAPAASPQEPEPPIPQPGYVARIKFPPRRTADGSRISAMPVAEAERVLAELTGGVSGAAQLAVEQVSVAPQAVAPPQAVPAPQKISAAAAPLARVRRLTNYAAWGDVPTRRSISAREMEAIELGGADP